MISPCCCGSRGRGSDSSSCRSCDNSSGSSSCNICSSSIDRGSADVSKGRCGLAVKVTVVLVALFGSRRVVCSYNYVHYILLLRYFLYGVS